MSEGSLPPFGAFGSKFLPFSLARRAALRIKKRFRRGDPDKAPKTASDPNLRSEAAEAIREQERAHFALFDRAERFRAQAERLRGEGTPSDSAENRAQRAEGEISDILAGLRASFAASIGDKKGKVAFDEEIKNRYPGLRIPETDS